MTASPSRFAPPISAQSRGHILFADDDVLMLRATASALAVSGFEVTPVESGERALAKLADRLPDALLLDINMPGNESMALVQALRRDQPLIPIVLLTGNPALETAVRAVRLGVVDYLSKSDEITHLVERLDLAVRRGRVLHSVKEAEQAASRLLERLDTLKEAACWTSSGYLGWTSGAARDAATIDPLRNLPPGDVARLSARERQVLLELAGGHAPQRIATSLELSTNTVRNHLKSIFAKLQVNSQVSLLAKLAAARR